MGCDRQVRNRKLCCAVEDVYVSHLVLFCCFRVAHGVQCGSGQIASEILRQGVDGILYVVGERSRQSRQP